VRRDGAYVPDEAYRQAVAKALGADGRAAAAALAAHPEVELQPPLHQGEHKASFFTPWPVAERLVGELRALAAAVGARVGFVVSRDVVTGRGLLDALPEGVAKDRAVERVAGLLGLGSDQVVFAGDSGNDEAALLAGFRSVVVGNAPAPLVERLREEAERRGRLERIYFAREHYAAGVLEGCRHFGIF
jgi:alpha-amylase